MATLGTLVVRVTADVKQAMGGLGAVEAKAKGTTTALRGLGKVGGLALLGIGIAAVDAALDFEKAFATIRAGTGATGKDLEKLKKDFKTVFAGVPQSTEEVSTAIADLNTRLGLTGEPLRRMAKQFLDLSRITKTDVAGNIRNITRVFGDFSVATDKQKTSLDFLFRASQATGASVSNLAAKMVQYGAPLRQIGFDFETSVAMMAKWEKEGVNVEAILGSLKIALGKFAKAGEAPAEAFKRVVEEIKKAPSAAEAATVALNAFGSRAMADAVGAIREGRFEFSEFLTTLKDGTETIEKAGKEAKTTGEKLAEAWHKVKIEIEPLGVIILDSLIPALQAVAPVVKVVADAIKTLTAPIIELAERIKELKRLDEAIERGEKTKKRLIKTTNEYTLAMRKARIEGKLLIDVWLEQEIASQKVTKETKEWFSALRKGIQDQLEYTKGQEKARKAAEEWKKANEALAKSLHENIRQALGMKTEWADLAVAIGSVSRILQDVWETFRKPPPTTALTDFVKFFSDALPDAIRSSWNLKVAPMLARLKPPDKMKESFAASMEEAFISGFDRALHNIGDLWKAFVIGLGDALAAQLSKALGSSFLGKIGGAIGGQLIGSLFSWIGGLFGGGGKSKAEKEMERRAAAEKAAADAARLYAERLAAANQAIEDAVRQLQDLAIQIPTMAAGIVSGVISRRRMARGIRPLRRQLRRAFGTQISWGFDPETEQDVERRTGLQKLLRQFGGKRDIIDIKEFRQLLAFAKQQGATPEQIRMLENLVEQLNQRALINIQIQNQKRLLREAEKERDLIKRNLPRMRELLREIERNTRKRGGGKGDGWRGDGDDEELPPPKSQSSLEFMIDSGRSRFSRQSIRRL